MAKYGISSYHDQPSIKNFRAVVLLFLSYLNLFELSNNGGKFNWDHLFIMFKHPAKSEGSGFRCIWIITWNKFVSEDACDLDIWCSEPRINLDHLIIMFNYSVMFEQTGLSNSWVINWIFFSRTGSCDLDLWRSESKNHRVICFFCLTYLPSIKSLRPLSL